MKLKITTLALMFILAGTSVANAIPALQLGPSGAGWAYSGGTPDTWVYDGSSSNMFSLAATANATTGNGAYAWTSSPDPNQYAYLVASVIPKTASTEPPSIFDITVSNATFHSSGNGAPPVGDPNDLSSHGIFDTYYEIYEFRFDGSVTTISDTQPGGLGTGDGYEEFFDITVNSLADGFTGVHFDLFTIQGSGQLTSTSMVSTNAPFSHDAEYVVPESGSMILLALGMVGMATAYRRKKS